MSHSTLRSWGKSSVLARPQIQDLRLRGKVICSLYMEQSRSFAKLPITARSGTQVAAFAARSNNVHAVNSLVEKSQYISHLVDLTQDCGPGPTTVFGKRPTSSTSCIRCQAPLDTGISDIFSAPSCVLETPRTLTTSIRSEIVKRLENR